jgi:hypothetical protein
MELGSSFSLREVSDHDSLASPLLVRGSLAVTLFFFAFWQWRRWAHHSLVNCWVGRRWVGARFHLDGGTHGLRWRGGG